MRPGAARGFWLAVGLFLGVGRGWDASGAELGATLYIIVLSGALFQRFRGGRWRAITIFGDVNTTPVQGV